MKIESSVKKGVLTLQRGWSLEGCSVGFITTDFKVMKVKTQVLIDLLSSNAKYVDKQSKPSRWCNSRGLLQL